MVRFSIPVITGLLMIARPAGAQVAKPLPSADEIRREVLRKLDEAASCREWEEHRKAMALAEAAYREAVAGLPAADPARHRAAVALDIARANRAIEEANAASGAGQKAVAKAKLTESQKFADAAEKYAGYYLGREHRDRFDAMMTQANVALRRSDADGRLDVRQAEAIYLPVVAATERAGGSGARARAEAFVMLAHFRMQAGADGSGEVARLVAEVGRMRRAGWLGPADAIALKAHQFVALRLWMPELARAKQAPANRGQPGAIESAFLLDLERFRAALVKAGADASLATLGRLALAKYHWESQRVDAVARVLGEIEPVATSAGGEAYPIYAAEYWSWVGVVATERGELARARAAHESAIGICRRHGIAREQALYLNQLGMLQLRQGDYRAARARLQESAELYARDALKVDVFRPQALTNLAKTFEEAGELGEAERLHREAIGLVEANPFPNPFGRCLCRNNLGVCLAAAGRFAEAVVEFEAARTLAVEAFGGSHLRVAQVDANLGWVNAARGRNQEAGTQFRAALEGIRASSGEAHPGYAEVLGYLARNSAEAGRRAEAREMIGRALALREAALAKTLASPLTERGRLAFVQELRVHPESKAWPGVLDTYLELATTLQIPAEDQYRRLLAWKGALAWRTPPRVQDAGDDPEARRIAEGRSAALDRLRIAFRTGAAGTSPGREAELIRLEGEVEEWDRRFRERCSQLPGRVEPPQVGPDEVRAGLPANSALLDVIEIRRASARKEGEPAEQARAYVGYLVRADRPPSRVDFGDAGPIDAAVRALVRAAGDADEDFSSPADRLGRALRDPIVPQLAGVDTLIVAGDGLLHRLPLGALPGVRPGSRWVEDLAFATVPNAQALVARRRDPRPASSGAIILGGVDYGRLADEWPTLRATRAEAESVAQAFRAGHAGEPVDLLLDAAGSEPALRNLLPTRRLAHLATHGFFRADDAPGESFATFGLLEQFDSGLVLAKGRPAPADHPDDDQILTAADIGRLDLHGVDLVVLSACSSGLGHVMAGQGVIGLLGALDRAGAGATLCSLWPIDDDATYTLMSAFYRHLWPPNGPSPGPSRALRAAQLEMLKSTAKSPAGVPFAHPQSWAGFVLSGDPAPPPAPSRSK